MAHVSFTLNGRRVSADADGSPSLLQALREQLGATGTKLGCGAGLCGACTVLVDGRTAHACRTRLAQVAGRQVGPDRELLRQQVDALGRALGLLHVAVIDEAVAVHDHAVAQAQLLRLLEEENRRSVGDQEGDFARPGQPDY